MMNTTFQLHHVGYTVADIKASANLFALFGYKAGEILYDEELQVELCYLTRTGSVTIELVHQLQADSLEARLLDSEGVMPYHLAYECADIEAACVTLDTEGYKRLFDPIPVSALGGMRICYFHHPQIGYIELVEKA